MNDIERTRRCELCTANIQPAQGARMVEHEVTDATEHGHALCGLCFLLFKIRMFCWRPKVGLCCSIVILGPGCLAGGRGCQHPGC